MAPGPETSSFEDMEKTGWTHKAGAYDDHLGQLSRDAIAPLLDAVDAGRGTRLLEIACGPGYGAGAATARGADAIGTDFAPAMVDVARRNFPDTDFREGNGEALEFDDAGFDAVICSLGLLHFPHPEKAMAEAFRVLKPGGRYAFTVWCAPEKAKLFAIILDAIDAHGNTDVPLPPAPPFFRLSNPETSRTALRHAGFTGITMAEIPLTLRVATPDALRAIIYKSTVRTAAMLELQTDTARAAIHAAMDDAMDAYKTDTGFAIPAPVMMACATRV